MLASMYSAVSGLQAHQTKMNVIGNNIANVNTYGFKKSRATFTDVFYQTLTGSSAATQISGGVNSSQLGYGSTVNSIDVIHKTAGSSTTDRALDVYINGDGYLAVKDSNGTVNYTRVGVLDFDASGNLVDSNGNFVLGFKLDETTGQAQLNSDGTTTVQNLVKINVPVEELDEYTSISIGSSGDITAIKEGNQVFTIGQTSWLDSAADMAEDNTLTGSVNVTDVTNINTTYTDADAADKFTTTGTGINVAGDITFTYSTNDATTSTASDYTLTYKDLEGNNKTLSGADYVTVNNTADPVKVEFKIPNRGATFDKTDATTYTTYTVEAAVADLNGTGTTAGSAVVGSNKIDSADITISTFNKAGQTITSTATWNNSAAATSQLEFTSTSGNLTLNVKNSTLENAIMNKGVDSIVDGIGSIGTGDGTAVKIAQLALATFTNEAGLSQNGQGYFLPSNNSGTAVIKVPGTGGTGGLRSGALEMSNVDLSFEFTEMIICQRGFQANTKMITVSDEMLSELVSMKR